MLSKSVDYVHLEEAGWFGEAKLGAWRETPGGREIRALRGRASSFPVSISLFATVQTRST